MIPGILLFAGIMLISCNDDGFTEQAPVSQPYDPVATASLNQNANSITDKYWFTCEANGDGTYYYHSLFFDSKTQMLRSNELNYLDAQCKEGETPLQPGYQPQHFPFQGLTSNSVLICDDSNCISLPYELSADGNSLILAGKQRSRR